MAVPEIVNGRPRQHLHEAGTVGRDGASPSFRRWLPSERGLLLVVCIAAAAAIVYAALGIRLHRTLHSTAFDLAFFDQIIWNTAHGRWFQTTYVPYTFLGQHFEPLLVIPAALYRLGGGPETLISIQAIGASLAAVPLYLCARRLAGTGAGVLVSVAYLISPSLQQGLNFDFHPDLFIPVLAFSALAVLLSDRKRPFIAIVGVLLLVKEDSFLIAAALGWVWWLRRDRRLGAAIIVGSVVYGAVVIGLLMPHFREGRAGDLVERYGYLGSSAPSIIAGALSHPIRVIGHLTSSGPAKAALGLLASTAFLPLLAPEVLVAALPAALVGLLSTHPQQQALELQYGAPVLALVFISALIGSERIASLSARYGAPDRSRYRKRNTLTGLAACLALASAGAAALFGRFPPEGGAQMARFHDDGSSAALERVSRLLPPDASLSAQSGLAAHLSQRRVQWEFPRLQNADYVIVQDGGERSSQSSVGYEEARARLPDLGYSEIAHDGSIHLYRRNASREAAP